MVGTANRRLIKSYRRQIDVGRIDRPRHDYDPRLQQRQTLPSSSPTWKARLLPHRDPPVRFYHRILWEDRGDGPEWANAKISSTLSRLLLYNHETKSRPYVHAGRALGPFSWRLAFYLCHPRLDFLPQLLCNPGGCPGWVCDDKATNEILPTPQIREKVAREWIQEKWRIPQFYGHKRGLSHIQQSPHAGSKIFLGA